MGPRGPSGSSGKPGDDVSVWVGSHSSLLICFWPALYVTVCPQEDSYGVVECNISLMINILSDFESSNFIGHLLCYGTNYLIMEGNNSDRNIEITWYHQSKTRMTSFVFLLYINLFLPDGAAHWVMQFALWATWWQQRRHITTCQRALAINFSLGKWLLTCQVMNWMCSFFRFKGEAGKPGKSGERGPSGPQVRPLLCLFRAIQNGKGECVPVNDH